MRAVATIGTVAVLAGCTQTSTYTPIDDSYYQQRAAFEERLRPYQRQPTYAEIVESRGIPTRKETLPDGSFVAEWTPRSSGWIALPGPSNPQGMQWPTVVAPIPGETVRLRFDSSGKLLSGQRN